MVPLKNYWCFQLISSMFKTMSSEKRSPPTPKHPWICVRFQDPAANEGFMQRLSKREAPNQDAA